MVSPMLLGIINGPVLLLATVAILVTGVLALRRIHRGEPAPLVAVAVMLVLPLAFIAWASTAQHHAAMEWAMAFPRPAYKQTYMAAMLSRTIATQLYGGAIVAISGVSLLAGALALTVRGERPHWLTGGVAGVLVLGLISTAIVGMTTEPFLVVGSRLVLYVAAGGLSVAALVAAHRRGPGTQLATLVAVVLPLTVVATDLSVLGTIASLHLTEVAAAPPPAKQALLDSALATLQLVQTSAWISLGLAAALSLLGPAIAWRRERPHATATLAAMAGVLVLAGVTLSTTLSWTTGW